MEDERRINWFSLFIKIIIIFVFILIIIWLFSKIINRNRFSKTFMNNINNMEKVSTEYFKGVDLPLDKGGSLKVTLGELIDKKLIVPSKNDEDNKCNTEKSFSKITRKLKYYTLETTLKCGKEEKTISKKFSLKDCKNCGTSKKENATNKSDSKDKSKSSEKNNNSSNKENKANNKSNGANNSGTTYYEYVKETTTYSKWMRGNKSGNNIENKYEYYGTASQVYYMLGYIPESKIENEYNYTIKLDTVPREDYYFSTIEESNYYNSLDENKYVNNNSASLYDSRNNKKINSISKYALDEDNFTYKLYPYYRKGNYYIDVKVNVNNTDGVTSYYDSNLNEKIYYIPIKVKAKFASNQITSAKPSGDYDTITYYRYIIVDKETIWSSDTYKEGYTKTGNTKVE